MHDADHVGRIQAGAQEVGERPAGAHAVPPAHVVVVEEHDEDARIGALGLALLVVGVDDLARRLRVRRGHAGDLDPLERLDRLQLAVLEDLEVGGLQIPHVVAVVVRDDYVDPDEVDARPEDGRLVLRVVAPRLGGGRRGRRRVLLLGVHTRGQGQDERAEQQREQSGITHGHPAPEKDTVSGTPC